MNPSRFSLQQLMVATGVLGVVAGLLARYPEPMITTIASAGGTSALVFFAYVGFRWFIRLPLRARLAIELATLLFLVAMSALVWTPGFYLGEPERCEELARRASVAASDGPELRAALDREAAWFTRKASELRWRGLWLGLTMGPSSDDYAMLARREEVYQLGVLESIEKHEKRLEPLIHPGSPAP